MKRWLVLLYGVVCYALFLVTFLYLAGFIGGILVPTKLDGPPNSALSEALVVDVLLVLVFGLQHSLMARPGFKRWWTRFVPLPAERSTYVLATNAALGLLFWQWRPLGGVIWDFELPLMRIVAWTLFALGWFTVLVTTFLINHFDLFGLRQVWLYFRGQPYTHLPFVTPGPYRLVRHPLYVGWLLAFWATPTMTVAHCVFAGVMTAYILVAIVFEERDLVRVHADYAQYRRRVPMLLPRVINRRTNWVSQKQSSFDENSSSIRTTPAVGKPRLDVRVLGDASWWHWALSIPLLVAGLNGVAWAIPIAIGLCALVGLFYLAQLRSVRPFPVQVRLAYLVLLALGSLPGWQWVHWLQLIGTTTMVTIGYCPLERLLRLLPSNRTQPLSGNYLWRTMVTDPCIGGLIGWTVQSAELRPSCSMTLAIPTKTAI